MNRYNPKKYTYTYVVRYSVVLTRHPQASNEAATKQYLTNRLSSIATTSLSGSAKFATFRLPTGFTGDLTVTVGAPSIWKLSTVTTAGTYTTATINARGIITAGGSITTTNLSGILSYTKITAGKPTTVSGYGISDAYSNTANVLTGPVLVSYTPSAASDLVSKGYITSGIAAISAEHAVGDVFCKGVTTTPAKMLRCNGGILSKTTYASLYAVIGDAFNVTTTAGSGRPWSCSYAINTKQSKDITGWQTNGTLPATVYDAVIAVTKSRVYILGGRTTATTTGSTTVYTAPINADGTIGAWITGTALPVALYQAQSIVTKSRLYVMGGMVDTGIRNSVYYAPINTDGTLGAWVTATNLPTTFYGGQAIVTANRVYLLSSMINGVISTATYTAPIDADGAIGTWTTGSTLPAQVSGSHAVVTRGRVYLIAGRTANVVSTAVYTATFGSDGIIGTWSTTTAVPVAIEQAQLFLTKNRIYLIGGRTASTGSTAVYHAPVNTDGTIGAWVSGTALPNTIGKTCMFASSSRLFLLGGLINTTPTNLIYAAIVEGNLNDYTPYYDGTTRAVYTTEFSLPDYSSIETLGKYHFIKYM